MVSPMAKPLMVLPLKVSFASAALSMVSFALAFAAKAIAPLPAAPSAESSSVPLSIVLVP